MKENVLNKWVRNKFFLICLFFFGISFAKNITYCNEQDCLEVPEKRVNERIKWCVYKAEITMLLTEWKIKNNFKQVDKDRKVICLLKIPSTFFNGQETEKQLDYLEQQRCKVHNLKIDPIRAGNKVYYACMHSFLSKQLNVIRQRGDYGF